ncbi:MAG: hypothetical protein GC161_02235 [Planctomycetaceae bacterium]|nr:hypothetical protein [Planctomycetaceae bacterium]
MLRHSNVRRAHTGWLLAPVSVALVAHVLVMAVPHARLDVARAQRDEVLRRADERSQLLRELAQFEGENGPKLLDMARRRAQELVPPDCPALFAQAALDASLRNAAIVDARAEVGATMPLVDRGDVAVLLGRRIDVRGQASLAEIVRWHAELEALAGPVAVLEAVFTPSTQEQAPPNSLEFRIAAQLVHRP